MAEATLITYWREVLAGDLLAEQAPLARYTSMRVGGPAEVLAVPTRLSRLLLLLRSAVQAGVPVTILGGGSNVLIPDEGIQGLVVVNHCRGMTILEGDPPRVWAEGGMPLAGLARALVQRGIDGMTWAVSIPGTLGGAVVGNAGAHGGSMAEVVERVALLYEDGGIENVPVEALCYGYRTSVLKQKRAAGDPFPVVVGAMLALTRGDMAELRRQAQAYLRYRRRTQPGEPSVGSIFRNPPGDYAGRLIEAAGLKGTHVGGAMISPIHANFIVNTGNARTADVLTLISRVQERVRKMFGVQLQPEILVLGEERVGTRARRRGEGSWGVGSGE